MKKLIWPEYSNDGKAKLGLDEMIKLLNKIGNPQEKIPPIFHIAGTNGKGSTTSFIKYILEAEGYKVHRFTSPHLIDVNERIEISSNIITDDYLNELSKECKFLVEKYDINLSYFEGQMFIAFLAFLRNPAIATILEVGLGGRLDATNVIKNPLVSVITSLSYDHTKILGDTIDRIAFEKAGIIKNNGNVIVGKQNNEVIYNFFDIIAKCRNVNLYKYDKDWNIKKIEDTFIFYGFGRELELPKLQLYGKHQIYNAGNAIAAILSQNKIKVSNKAIICGLKNTEWPGRLQNIKNTKLGQFLPKDFELWLDGAHNEGGATIINDWIDEENKKEKMPTFVIIGMLSRKNSYDFIDKLKKSIDYAFGINIHTDDEIKDCKEIQNELLSYGIAKSYCEENFIDALKNININFGTKFKKARVLICGSLYLVGEVLEYIKNN